MSLARPDPLSLSSDSSTRAEIVEAIALARASGQTRWIAHVIDVAAIDALECYAKAGLQDRFFWERVDSGESLCAWGCVDEAESAGIARFEDIRSWSEGVCARLHWSGVERPPTAPVFVGGFGFEDEAASSEDWKAFPSTRFVLPAVIGEQRGGRARWIVFARIEPAASVATVESELGARLAEALAPQPRAPRGSELNAAVEACPDQPVDSSAAATTAGDWPPGPEYRVRADRAHHVYTQQVRRALDEIETGRLQKIVLARSLRVDHDGPLDVPAFLGRLRAIYPSCTLVAVGRGQDTFLAATPETLVLLEGNRVQTAALAGSAPRGRTPEEDRVLADALDALLASVKDRAEHSHVVEAIRGVLEPLCEALELPTSPRLRALFGIQHLETPVQGRLRTKPREPAAGRRPDLLDLVASLHPTPAVGGVPGAVARDWLRRFEGLDRGWYAAPIGWLDAEGGGDFRVALRSALIRNGLAEQGVAGASRARLFAGAGIVAGSQPEQELTETRIKLRALLAPLTEI